MTNLISHQEIVNAPIEKVWDHLIYKIEHPQYFVPNVEEVEVLEKKASYTIRKMKLKMPDQTLFIVEKITWSTHQVRFEITEHPTLEGFVDNFVEAITNESTLLTYKMNWQNKITKSSANNLDILKSAVLKSKNFIEDKS